MRAFTNTLSTLAIALVALAFLSTPSLADADHGHPALPAPEHAPIGVMGDHMHEKGEWMLSYRYMHMAMGGNRIGTNGISTADTLNQFMVSPLEMDMGMHMLGTMYGVTDKVTVMAMVGHIKNDMDHVTRMGGEFTTNTKGFGDIKLSAMVSLVKQARHRVHATIGVSMPTGSISKRGAIPINPDAQLPYPMQIGSGTWDILPALTYSGTSDRFYWGAQASAVIRTGTNNRNYSLGNRLQLTAWNMLRLTEAFDAGLRVTYTHWGRIDGADPMLMPMMVQTANPSLQGGDRVDLSLALNYQFQNGALNGHRLAAEIGMPIYQNLNGPQMETDWVLTVGWQKSF